MVVDVVFFCSGEYGGFWVEPFFLDWNDTTQLQFGIVHSGSKPPPQLYFHICNSIAITKTCNRKKVLELVQSCSQNNHVNFKASLSLCFVSWCRVVELAAHGVAGMSGCYITTAPTAAAAAGACYLLSFGSVTPFSQAQSVCSEASMHPSLLPLVWKGLILEESLI